MDADSPLVTYVYPSPNCDHPAGKRSGVFVVHSIECPLEDRYVKNLAGPGYMGGSAAGVSTQYVVGPTTIAQCVPESARAWGCGPQGNIISVQAEQTGYARYDRDEWLSPQGRAQIRNMGRLIADWARRGGYGTQRLSASQLRAYHDGTGTATGWVTHSDISHTLGGTSHTDPGSGYPFDVLQADIDAAAGKAPHPKPPTPAPNPAPTDDQEDLDMRLIMTRDSKRREVWGLLRADGLIEYIDDPDRLSLLRKAGVKRVEVSRAEYNSSRAPGTNKVA